MSGRWRRPPWSPGRPATSPGRASWAMPPPPRPRRANAGSRRAQGALRRRSLRSAAWAGSPRARPPGILSEAQEYLPPVEEAGDREAEEDAEERLSQAAQAGPQP